MWKASPLMPYPTSSAMIGAPRCFARSKFLEDQNTGAFADDESVAVLVERPRSALRLFVAGGQSAHGGEPADAHRRDRGFGTAADHDVGIAAGNHAKRIADSVSAG